MFLVAALALCPPPFDERPPVCLAEAERFGVPEYAVRGLWQVAARQEETLEKLVTSPWNNDPGTAARWQAECRWRASAWFLLDDVVGCPSYTPDHKLRSLTRLRDLIGDEAFYAGRMPEPLCPGVKVPAWRPRD